MGSMEQGFLGKGMKVRNIGLAKKVHLSFSVSLFRLFHNISQKNLNELFGQSNSMMYLELRNERCSKQLRQDIMSFNFLFIQLVMAALSLCCFARAFSSCGNWGLLSSCGVRASHWGGFSFVEHGLQACELQQLQCTGSVVVAEGSSCGTGEQLLCSMWNPPDHGLNSQSLHWHMDS